jgi:hypothetical protein
MSCRLPLTVIQSFILLAHRELSYPYARKHSHSSLRTDYGGKNGLISLLLLILNNALNSAHDLSSCNVLNGPTCIHPCIRARRCLWEYIPIYIKIIRHALQNWRNFLQEVYWMRIQVFCVVTQSSRVIYSWDFEATYRHHFQGFRNRSIQKSWPLITDGSLNGPAILRNNKKKRILNIDIVEISNLASLLVYRSTIRIKLNVHIHMNKIKYLIWVVSIFVVQCRALSVFFHQLCISWWKNFDNYRDARYLRKKKVSCSLRNTKGDRTNT